MTKQGTRILDRRVFYDGQAVFKEGDAGDTAFLIEEGQVRLTRNSGTSEETDVAMITKGAIFGEMAIFDHHPRMATARAIGTVTLTVIGRRQLDAKLARLQQSDRRLIKELMDYCRQTQIFEERLKNPESARESQRDGLTRKMLEVDYEDMLSRQSDSFLRALCSILKSYVLRRLPPAENA